ncbi:MAG: amidohydrolase family protein [Desulfotignum sp.]|jgi:imidazolonepropionase-like amidohydrolase|nr:amidohydrolase family protein [Desulfotignum sp.]
MKTLYKNGTIITGTGDVLDPGWLLVENDTIAGVGPMTALSQAVDALDNTKETDLSGLTIMPGMIDCHVHLVMDGSPDPTAPLMTMDDATAAIRMMIHARQTLNAGFTTVRDLGCLNHVGLRVRDAINQGWITGPRILGAGQMICMTGGHGWQIGREADGPDEVRKAVRAQIKAGADVIKLMATGGICTRGVEPGHTQYSFEEMRAGIIEAHKAGIPAAAHAQGLEGVKIALEAGIDTIEHGMNLDEEAIDMMYKNQIPLIPTLAAGACIIRHGRQSGIPSFIVEKSERHRQERIQSCIHAWRAGVSIALGTDAGTPFNRHGNNAAELSELAVTGMKSHDILLAATGNAASAIGISHITGTLAPGMQADFLVLKQNPLENIRVLLERQTFLEIHMGGNRIDKDNGCDT